VRIKLNLRNGELADLQKAIRRISTEKRAKIHNLLEEVSMNAAADAADKAPVNVGTLSRNIRHKVTKSKGGLEATGEIESAASYSSAVEFGRSPGTMPPVGDGSKEGILYWVRRKGIARGWSVKTRRMSKATDAQKQAEISMAWAIAKKIEQRGTQPQPFMRPAHEKWSKIFQDHLYQILRQP
jgi:HK97 gp10 family phage protein